MRFLVHKEICSYIYSFYEAHDPAGNQMLFEFIEERPYEFLAIHDARAASVDLIWTLPGTGELKEKEFDDILKRIPREVEESFKRYENQCMFTRGLIVVPSREGYDRRDFRNALSPY